MHRPLPSWVHALLAAALLATAAPRMEAESCHWPLGVAGVTLGDLADLQLYDLTTTPATALADPGVTLTALDTGIDYEIGGLPDAEPGTGEHYALDVSYLGTRFVCTWPTIAQTVQPQAVSFQIGFVPSARLLELAAGDLIPFAEGSAVGLTSDPTGAGVTFSLVDSAGVAVLDDVSAELASSDSYVGHDGATRWRALLRYRWTAEDADLEPGDYTYSFRITFPGSPPRPMTIPPPRSWPARIYE
jgi:hypothetical protein